MQKEFIKNIKEALPLKQLFQQYAIRQNGSSTQYFCPFHEDKSPSLSIADDLNSWKCFAGCGSGDSLDFIQKIENISFKDSLEKASSISGIPSPSKKFTIKSANPLSKKHFDYLLSVRGITKESALKFDLKSRGDSILFPQTKNDQFVGYKRRHMTNKKSMAFEGEDRKSKLWPNNSFNVQEELWLVSGEFETMILSQIFLQGDVNNHVVRTNSTGENNFPKDINETISKSNIKRINILYDHDDAGQLGANKLASHLLSLALPIRIYTFDETKPKKYDLVDFFNDGSSLQDFFSLKSQLITKKEDNSKLDVLDNFTFKTPPDYFIDEKGVSKLTFNAKMEPKVEVISPYPVILSSLAINTDEKTIRFELSYKRGDQWESIPVDRETISDSRKIISLSNNGFPVNSANARKVIEFLHAFEHSNLPYIKTIYLTHSNGWKSFNHQKVFGLGSTIFGLEDDSKEISFQPDNGFERFARAIKTQGNLENWKDTMNSIFPFDHAAFALYASFAAPLLSLVEAPNFIIHYWGDSSMGKTTALEIASSVWGNPAKETGGLVTSWNNTQVFIEKIASFFNDLPLFLDDSQTTEDKTISKVLYMIANSVGRGRGSIDGGVRDLKFWHTVCFSTGEKQLTDSTQYDGAKARTIELAGSPFSRHQGKLVNSIKSSIRENYGQAGLIFIEHLFSLLQKEESIKHLKEKYRSYRDKLSDKANNEIGDRMAHYFAVIWLSSEIAMDCLQLKGNPSKTILTIFEESINNQANGGDMATRAMQDVVSYSQANMKSFMGKSDRSIKEHFGVWKDAEYIAIYPHKLKSFLSSCGYTYNAILRSWAERNWIKTNQNKFSYPVYFENNSYRLIVLQWSSIFEV